MCESHRRFETTTRTQAQVAPSIALAPSARAIEVARKIANGLGGSPTGGNPQKIEAPTTAISMPASIIQLQRVLDVDENAKKRLLTTSTQLKPKSFSPSPESILGQVRGATEVVSLQSKVTNKLAELAKREQGLRDDGNLNENLFNTEVLRELARLLGLNKVQARLSDTLDKKSLAAAASIVRQSLLQKAFSNNAGALVGIEKPDILK